MVLSSANPTTVWIDARNKVIAYPSLEDADPVGRELNVAEWVSSTDLVERMVLIGLNDDMSYTTYTSPVRDLLSGTGALDVDTSDGGHSLSDSSATSVVSMIGIVDTFGSDWAVEVGGSSVLYVALLGEDVPDETLYEILSQCNTIVEMLMALPSLVCALGYKDDFVWDATYSPDDPE